MSPRLFGLIISSAGAVVSLILFVSCDNDPVSPGHAAIYAGSYSQGIEYSIFKPCAVGEAWMITFASDEVASRFMMRVLEVVGSSNPMYTSLRGVPSEKGSFKGIFVTFDRQFEVTEILDAHELTLDDCLNQLGSKGRES